MQPLRMEIAEAIRLFLAEKQMGDRAFNMPERRNNAAMFRADLEAAGIPYRDQKGGVADFHALRHTCGSWLLAEGVHPKIIQKLMRHSCITLTMDRYAHTLQADEPAALPNVFPTGKTQGAKTPVEPGENWASRVRKHANQSDKMRQDAEASR